MGGDRGARALGRSRMWWLLPAAPLGGAPRRAPAEVAPRLTGELEERQVLALDRDAARGAERRRQPRWRRAVTTRVRASWRGRRRRASCRLQPARAIATGRVSRGRDRAVLSRAGRRWGPDLPRLSRTTPTSSRPCRVGRRGRQPGRAPAGGQAPRHRSPVARRRADWATRGEGEAAARLEDVAAELECLDLPAHKVRNRPRDAVVVAAADAEELCERFHGRLRLRRRLSAGDDLVERGIELGRGEGQLVAGQLREREHGQRLRKLREENFLMRGAAAVSGPRGARRHLRGLPAPRGVHLRDRRRFGLLLHLVHELRRFAPQRVPLRWGGPAPHHPRVGSAATRAGRRRGRTRSCTPGVESVMFAEQRASAA